MSSQTTINTPSESDDVLTAELPSGAPTAFFDRFYFNMHGAEPLPLIMLGVGLYPGVDVIDGYVIRVDRGLQRNHRFASEISAGAGNFGPASSLGAVGPISFEILEPLRVWRLQLGPNPTGVEFDVIFTGRTAPWATEKIHLLTPSGSSSDFEHFFQSGNYQGSMSLDGEPVDLARWLGTRDRSTGVRLVTEGGGFHIWVQAQFAKHAIAFLYNEDRQHQVTHCDGAILHTDGTVDPIERVEHDLIFDDQLEFSTGVLTVHSRSGAIHRLEVDGTFGGGFLSGGGYNGWHGKPRGIDHEEFESWVLDGSINPRSIDVPLTDRPARFVDGGVDGNGEIGSGVFEFATTRSPSFSYHATASLR